MRKVAVGRRMAAVWLVLAAACWNGLAAVGQPDGPGAAVVEAEAADEPAAAAASAWGAREAAHLLRRAGFGGKPEEIDRLAGLGRDAAVDDLVDYESVPFEFPEFEIPGPARPLVRAVLRGPDQERRKQVQAALRQSGRLMMEDLRAWWLLRMVQTPRPLQEKMTLFWHGLLTSGFQEVKLAPLMAMQNGFLRRHAMDDFRTILVGISKDPAMLLYLNNAQNNKEHPNENYARELMELFVLGEGNYSEKDVTEAARAFTGWGLNRGTWEFQFYRGQHDNGQKTVLGRTGNFNGEDVIDILLEQPEASRHLAVKLWEFFAGTQPPEGSIDAIARRLRETDFSVREAVRTLLKEDAFYGSDVMAAKIKSPVELMVGAIRVLQAEPADLSGLSDALRRMGQSLFQPPNVKGWDGGNKWITTSTLYTRYNTVSTLITGTPPARVRARQIAQRRLGPEVQEMLAEMNVLDKVIYEPQVKIDAQPKYDPAPLLRSLKRTSPADVVDHLSQRLLVVPLPREKRKELIKLLKSDGQFDPADERCLEKVRGVLILMMSTPEFQLG